MLAAAIRTFGGREVLEVTELETPRPSPGEVRVRVKAAGIPGLPFVDADGAHREVETGHVRGKVVLAID